MKRFTAVLTMICLWASMCAVTTTTTGCNQGTISALVSTLGAAASTVAAMEGNQAVAAKLKADSAAFAVAVKNWKQGTPAQDAIQALNLVIDDLDLICPTGGPCGPYAPLIVLALGTAESIIAILNPTTQTYGTRAQVRKVNLGYYPSTAKDFKTAWNGICGSDPALASAAIK